jgi:hypothetical protein
MQGWSTISSHVSRWLDPADPVAARSWQAGGADILRVKKILNEEKALPGAHYF